MKYPETINKVRLALEREALASVRKLAWLRDNATDQSVQLAAAKEIVNHVKGKPRQETVIDVSTSVSADKAHIAAMLALVAKANPLISLDKQDYRDNVSVNHAPVGLPAPQAQPIEIIDISDTGAEGPPAVPPAGGGNNNQHPRGKNKRREQ